MLDSGLKVGINGSMQHSTIYIACPQCGKLGLLIERQGGYFCANCMFDYLQLKNDPARLDSVLLETARQKGFGPVFASALYERVSLTPPADAMAYIKKLAEKNNIDLFQKQGIFAKIVVRLVSLLMRKK